MAEETEAEFWSVKLTKDINGGYGEHKSGATLKNLAKYQADSLHHAGFAEEPKPQKAAVGENIASGTTADAVTGGNKS